MPQQKSLNLNHLTSFCIKPLTSAKEIFSVSEFDTSSIL